MKNLAPLFILVTAFGWADAPKINSVSVPKVERQAVYITFDPAPPAAQVRPRTRWVIYSTTADGGRRHRVLVVDTSTLSTEKTIRLEVDPPISLAATALDVSYYAKDGVVHADSVSFGGDKPGPAIGGAKDKDDADIYFKGSYTRVVNGDPVYDIDAFAGYMKALTLKNRNKTYIGRFGAYGQMNTKTSSTADPNSFLAYLVYQRHIGGGTHPLGPFSLPYFSYRFAGWEFDKSGTQLNFIDSPVLSIPMRLTAGKLGEIEPGIKIPHITFNLGTEFVNVRTSALAAVKQWHTRGLLGATFSTGYAPEKSGFDSIQLTSAYQVRLPSAPEIFYDSKFAPVDPQTGKKGDAPPRLGTQPRHNLDTKLTYSFVKWAGVSFEHTYGSAPPLFNKTENTFAFGLVLTMKQTSFGRYSILKP